MRCRLACMSIFFASGLCGESRTTAGARSEPAVAARPEECNAKEPATLPGQCNAKEPGSETQTTNQKKLRLNNKKSPLIRPPKSSQIPSKSRAA